MDPSLHQWTICVSHWAGLKQKMRHLSVIRCGSKDGSRAPMLKPLPPPASIVLKSQGSRSVLGTSLGIQWLGVRTSTAGGAGSLSGRGTKILHDMCTKEDKQKDPSFLSPEASPHLESTSTSPGGSEIEPSCALSRMVQFCPPPLQQGFQAVGLPVEATHLASEESTVQSKGSLLYTCLDSLPSL